jgi:hypothetical protein
LVGRFLAGIPTGPCVFLYAHLRWWSRFFSAEGSSSLQCLQM